MTLQIFKSPLLALSALLTFVSASAPALPESTATLATLNGKPVTMAEFTSYSQVIGSVEGRIYPSTYQAFLDYLLTLAHDQVATTITVTEHPHRKVPLKYPLLAQRRYLSQQLQVAVRDKSKLTDSEMEDWYNKHKNAYTKPAEIDAYHIFRQVSDKVPTSSTQTQRAVMEKVKMEADKGTSFGLLAQQYSEADSREYGGGIGRIIQGQPSGPQNRRINAKLEESLFKLKEGGISDIIETSHGLHLLYAQRRIEAKVPTLDELKARGIAGREAIAERMRNENQRLLEEARKKSEARVITTNVLEITSGNPVIQLGKAALTLAHLEEIYDRVFTRPWAKVRDNEFQVAQLLNMVLDDLLYAQAAEDYGIADKPENAKALETIGLRHKAQRKLAAVTAEAYPVTDDQLMKMYEESKDSLRQPEANGEVFIVTPKAYPDVPSQVRAANEARKIAEEAERRLRASKQLSMADLIAGLPSSDDVETSWSVVPRHKLGFSENFHMTAFDQSLPGVTEPGEISAPTKVGESYAIARLGARYPGEPPAFEQQRESLAESARILNQRRMKMDLLQELKSAGKLEILPAAEKLKEPEFDK